MKPLCTFLSSRTSGEKRNYPNVIIRCVCVRVDFQNNKLGIHAIFRESLDESLSQWKIITAGVPRNNVLRLWLYLRRKRMQTRCELIFFLFSVDEIGINNVVVAVVLLLIALFRFLLRALCTIFFFVQWKYFRTTQDSITQYGKIHERVSAPNDSIDRDSFCGGDCMVLFFCGQFSENRSEFLTFFDKPDSYKHVLITTLDSIFMVIFSLIFRQVNGY